MSPSVWIDTRKNKHGKNYLVRWEIRVSGARVQGAESCGPSKPHALNRANDIRKALYAGKSPEPEIQPTAFPAFAAQYLSNSKNTKAKNTYENFDKPAVEHFSKWFGGKLIGMVDKMTLGAWRDALLKDGYSPNTVRMRLRALSAAFGYAVEIGYLDRNPFEKRGRKSSLFPPAEDVARYITEPEVAKILPRLPRRAAEAAYFLLHTGLRHGELLALDWKDIHRPKEGKWVMTVFSPKTGTGREVVVETQAQAVMGEPTDSGKVFHGVTRTWIGKALRAAAPGVRVHDFRHTWATNFMYRYGDSFRLMYEGGWASMASAAVYQRIRKRDEPVELKPFPHYYRNKARAA